MFILNSRHLLLIIVFVI